VAISSLCGKTAVPTRTGYVASKHAMQGFFDTLRIELREVEWMWLCHRGLLQQISDKGLWSRRATVGQSPRDESNMTVEECVHQIVWAMERRKREHIMTLKGKVTPWAKLILPELVDRIAAYAARQLPLRSNRLLKQSTQFRRNRAQGCVAKIGAADDKVRTRVRSLVSMPKSNPFKWRHQPEIILLCVRWYLA